MYFVGIDIASETHVVAVVDEAGKVTTRPTPFGEDSAGYRRLLGVLPPSGQTLVGMEATGHYWQNLFAHLVCQGYSVAVINPMRTHNFAAEELRRAKTDALDALAIARFTAQKRPSPAALPDEATLELRELVRLRDRLLQDFGDRTRQLHRLVDLGFPEFTRLVPRLDGELASTILHRYPTAEAVRTASPTELASLPYAGRRRVGEELARALIEAAGTSVGAHHSEAYRLQVRYACEDLDLLRSRLRSLEADIDRTLGRHELGPLLRTIPGIGTQTAALLVGELGDPASFVDAAHLAAYIGIVPGTRSSGKRSLKAARLCPIGKARVRSALWMPTLAAVRHNPWLKGFYQGLLARGKPFKVAMVAAMRKLIAAVYSVAKHRRPFVPNIPTREVPAQA